MEKLTQTLASLLTSDGKGVISLTGAGGKTSTLKGLGAYYRSLGMSVLLTTTTKIQNPKIFDFGVDYAFMSEEEVLVHSPAKGESVFYAERHIMDPKKMTAPRMEVLDVLIDRYDVVIIEADGSRQLPLKYHTQRDPVISGRTSATLAVMGASAYGQCIDNVCFGFDSTKTVDTAFLNFLIADGQGLLKGAAGRTAVLVNQADLIRIPLSELDCPVPVVLGSILKDEVYDTRNV